MSDKNMARRTSPQVAFAGVDITVPMQQYLDSITFTDCEEDEADDLQIRLQDRDGLWLEKWLGDAIEAAASTSTEQVVASSNAVYRVTAKSGLNVRSGPGTSHSIYGALTFGTEIEVESISNGWATISYSGKTAYVSAQYIVEVQPGVDAEAPAPDPGFLIQAVFLQQNWTGDGKDKLLDCGQFELDAVTAEGPPSIINIKATSLPYGTQIRQTKKSHAWESKKLSAIVAEIAASGGMTFLYESSNDPFYERLEQVKTSDIEFLSGLCHDAGISLKVTNNIIVCFDQATYEANPAVIDIKRGDGSYLKWRLSTGEANTQYASCRVSYTDPATGKKIEATAYAEDYKADNSKNQQLEVTAKVSSIADAMALAEKRLRLNNKYGLGAQFTMPGNPNLMAGVTVTLTGWGPWSRKYIISRAQHTLGRSGYTTQIKLRLVLEGY